MAQVFGCIGLRMRGRPVVKNLPGAGYPLVARSRRRGPIDEVVSGGMKVDSSPKDLTGVGE